MYPVKEILYHILFKSLRKIRNRLIYSLVNNGTVISNKRTIMADLGCGFGPLLPTLSLIGEVVGLDIDKVGFISFKRNYAMQNRNIHLIVADIRKLPFKDNCLDVGVCASVLEHILEVEEVMKEVKRILKVRGFLVFGYPKETAFVRAVWKFFVRRSCIREPGILKPEEFIKSLLAHKSNYIEINRCANTYFYCLQRINIPPFISFYKVIKLVNIEQECNYLIKVECINPH